MFTFIENIIWATKFTLSQFVVISVGPHVFWIQIQNWNSAKTPFNCILLERKNSQTMMHTRTMRSVTHATGYHTGWCSWYQYACSATTFLFVSTIWLNWQKRLIQHNCLLRCRNCKFLFFADANKRLIYTVILNFFNKKMQLRFCCLPHLWCL